MTETNISTARVPQVTVIDPRIPEKAKLRVAAYARVSSDSEDQVNSYIAQVDFYSKHIAGKEDWEMVDIYPPPDEGPDLHLRWSYLVHDGRSLFPRHSGWRP